MQPPVKFFSKCDYNFLGYFDPIKTFLIIKINNFRGDLSDVSAKMAILAAAAGTGSSRE